MISDKRKRHVVKRALNYTLSFVLSGIFLYVAFHNVNFKDVLNTVANASIFWIVIFIFVWFLSHYIRALRWKVILHSVKPNASVKNLLGALMVGYAVNDVVPRFGEITRAILVGRWEGLSRSSMFGAIIVERIIDLIFMGLAILVSLLIWNDDLKLNFPWLASTFYITMLLMAGLILFLYFLIKYRERFFGVIIKVLNGVSHKLADKIANVFHMLTEGFRALKGAKNYLITFTLSIIMMLLYALTAYIGFFTVGMQNIKPVTYEMAWVLMSISAIGVVIPTPGGTGSYHALVKSVLVLLFGFDQVISLSYAFLTHLINYFLFIIVGIAFFLILNKRHENLLKLVDTEVDEL